MSPRRLPLCTLALVVVALAVDASPSVSGWFVFERTSIESGQLWRLLTGHLVHEVPALALLDLGALALLGAWIERRSRGTLLAVLGTSALVASCAVLLLTDFDRYLGSSALGSGLFAAAVVLVHHAGHRKLAAVAGLLFVAKLVLEGLGTMPSVLDLPAGFRLAPAAHVGGALGGLLVAVLALPRRAGAAIAAPRGSAAHALRERTRLQGEDAVDWPR